MINFLTGEEETIIQDKVAREFMQRIIDPLIKKLEEDGGLSKKDEDLLLLKLSSLEGVAVAKKELKKLKAAAAFFQQYKKYVLDDEP